MISIQTLQLQGLNLQLDSSGNIVGTFHKQRFLDELMLLEVDERGCFSIYCEKRRKPPRNGKNYTHIAPIVEIRSSLSPSEHTPLTTSDTDSFSQEEKW